MSDDEDTCPLCMETFDATDKNFMPCTCDYQICLWCFDKLKGLAEGGRCPACRTVYDEKNFRYVEVDRDALVKKDLARKKRIKEVKQTVAVAAVRRTEVGKVAPPPATTAVRNAAPSELGGMGLGLVPLVSTLTMADRASLATVRVIQRNLVYIIGLAPSIANEETLRRNEYFGQYGKILKVVVNRANLDTNGPNASASAYVTFMRKDDSLGCIVSMDGFWVEGRLLRASFGTTKYCNFFLRGYECNNPDCLYLHEIGDAIDSFTKEQMQHHKSYFHQQTHPGPGPGPSYTVDGLTVLPPPVKVAGRYQPHHINNVPTNGSSILSAPLDSTMALPGSGLHAWLDPSSDAFGDITMESYAGYGGDVSEALPPAKAPTVNVWKTGLAVDLLKPTTTVPTGPLLIRGKSAGDISDSTFAINYLDAPPLGAPTLVAGISAPPSTIAPQWATTASLTGAIAAKASISVIPPAEAWPVLSAAPVPKTVAPTRATPAVSVAAAATPTAPVVALGDSKPSLPSSLWPPLLTPVEKSAPDAKSWIAAIDRIDTKSLITLQRPLTGCPNQIDHLAAVLAEVSPTFYIEESKSSKESKKPLPTTAPVAKEASNVKSRFAFAMGDEVPDRDSKLSLASGSSNWVVLLSQRLAVTKGRYVIGVPSDSVSEGKDAGVSWLQSVLPNVNVVMTKAGVAPSAAMPMASESTLPGSSIYNDPAVASVSFAPPLVGGLPPAGTISTAKLFGILPASVEAKPAATVAVAAAKKEKRPTKKEKVAKAPTVASPAPAVKAGKASSVAVPLSTSATVLSLEKEVEKARKVGRALDSKLSEVKERTGH